MATITKTQEAQVCGTYVPTDLDVRKAAADFRLVQVCPNYIVWKNGKQERVTEKKLSSLQNNYNWECDF